MSETGASPVDLIRDLRGLGIDRGDVILVHSSLRAVGPVVGGPRAVLAALRAAVGDAGTILVPAFTPENSDSSPQFRATTDGMHERELAAHCAAMPAFDLEVTPASPTVGALAELVRRARESRRSAHPQTSFAAVGHLADDLTSGHDPTCHLGEASPLGRMYALPNAKVLMLGTGFATFTAFHLAEYRVPVPPRRTYNCVVRHTDASGGRWWSYIDVALDDRDFTRLGAAYRAVCPPRDGRVGAAPSLLVPLAPAVDFAVSWLTRHRSSTTLDRGPAPLPPTWCARDTSPGVSGSTT